MVLVFALFGGLFALTQYLQLVLGYGPLAAGIRMVPVATIAIAGPAGIRLARLWSNRAVITTGLLAVAAAFALLLHNLAGAEAPWREITWTWSRAGLLSRAIERAAPGGRVLVLSPDIFPVWPALTYAGAHSTLRTMNLWLLQAAYAACPPGAAPRYRAEAAMPPGEAFIFRGVAEDFARAPPEALLVSRNPGIPDCGGRGFDLIAYFSRHPAFAETFRRYRPVAMEVEGYRLFKRES
jgi:hypothetical protein